MRLHGDELGQALPCLVLRVRLTAAPPLDRFGRRAQSAGEFAPAETQSPLHRLHGMLRSHIQFRSRRLHRHSPVSVRQTLALILAQERPSSIAEQRSVRAGMVG